MGIEETGREQKEIRKQQRPHGISVLLWYFSLLHVSPMPRGCNVVSKSPWNYSCLNLGVISLFSRIGDTESGVNRISRQLTICRIDQREIRGKFERLKWENQKTPGLVVWYLVASYWAAMQLQAVCIAARLCTVLSGADVNIANWLSKGWL